MFFWFLTDRVPQHWAVWICSRGLGCAGAPVCIAVVAVIDWNNDLNPGHLLVPEGREEFRRNLQSALHWISISWLAGFYFRKKHKFSYVTPAWLCRQCQYWSQHRAGCRTPQCCEHPCMCALPGFLGSLQNDHVHASYHNPWKLVVHPGFCFSELEACLSQNKITAANKLFACVASPAQALFLCPGCRLRLWVNHMAGSGGSGRKQYWMGLFNMFHALVFTFQVDSWFWKSNRFSWDCRHWQVDGTASHSGLGADITFYLILQQHQ